MPQDEVQLIGGVVRFLAGGVHCDTFDFRVRLKRPGREMETKDRRSAV